MRRLSLLVVVAVVLLLPTAALAAASTHGELTGPEYQQLIFLRWKLKVADGINSSIFNCSTMPTLPTIHSQLLNLERTDCMAGFQLIRFNKTMKTYVRACDKHSVTEEQLTCLVAPYEQLDTLYFVYYTAETQIRQLTVSRDLPAACVVTLSDPTAVIADEQKAASAANDIVIQAESGNYAMFESDSKALVAAATAVSKGQQANDEPLSVCPHPKKHYET